MHIKFNQAQKQQHAIYKQKTEILWKILCIQRIGQKDWEKYKWAFHSNIGHYEITSEISADKLKKTSSFVYSVPSPFLTQSYVKIVYVLCESMYMS